MILTSDILAAAQYAAIMHHGQMRTGFIYHTFLQSAEAAKNRLTKQKEQT